MEKLEFPREDDPPASPETGPQDPDVYIPSDDPIDVPSDPPVDVPTDVPVEPPGDLPQIEDGDDLPPEPMPGTVIA